MKWFARRRRCCCWSPWLFNLGLLAYAMYALLGVMLVSRLLARQLGREPLGRRASATASSADVGDKVAVVVTVDERGALPVAWVLVEDLLPRDALVHRPPQIWTSRQAGCNWPCCRGGGRKTLFYQLECNQRGYYQIGPLVLETGDLFGLHRRYRRGRPRRTSCWSIRRWSPLEGYDVASRRPDRRGPHDAPARTKTPRESPACGLTRRAIR